MEINENEQLTKLQNELAEVSDKVSQLKNEIIKTLTEEHKEEIQLLAQEIQLHKEELYVHKEELKLHEKANSSHKNIYRSTLVLAVTTFILVAATAIGSWMSFLTLKDTETLNRTKLTHELFEQYKKQIKEDTAFIHWTEAVKSGVSDKDSALFTTESCYDSYYRFLNFFEEINSLYKKGLVDNEMVYDFFDTDLRRANNNKFLHKYISNRRNNAEKYDKDPEAGRLWDAFYICGKRINIPMDSIINKEYERIYYKDIKNGESNIYPHYGLIHQ
jgi:hypothetical protein